MNSTFNHEGISGITSRVRRNYRYYYQNKSLNQAINIQTNIILLKAAKLDKTPNFDQTPKGLAALLAENGGLHVGEIGTRIVGGRFYWNKLNNSSIRLRFCFVFSTGVTTPIEQVPYIVSMQVIESALKLKSSKSKNLHFFLITEKQRSPMRWCDHWHDQNLKCSTLYG